MMLLKAHKNVSEPHVHVPPDDPLFGWYIVMIIALVLLGGLFSGLTLGLMGLDSVNLQVLSLSGTDDERRQAPKVLRLLQSGRHTMLVVLLLGNTLINTSLPIFLDSIVGGGWVAILASTVLEVIFGGEPDTHSRSSRKLTLAFLVWPTEILPQSICSRYGLSIGAGFAPLVKALIILMYPIARPMGWLLDNLLGSHDEGVTYRKAELKTFVSLGVEDKLQDEELLLLGSVLDFSGKTVGNVMTPMDDVFKLSAERIVDDELVSEIVQRGYSRIPVFEPSAPGAFIGYLTIRSLVEYDPSDLKPASSLIEQVLPQCPPDLALLEAMSYFQTGRSHILLVTTAPGQDQGAIGIVTLEDVVEELIGAEIIDESDQYVDIHSRVPVVRPKHREQHPAGLKRIFEGRLARRRVVMETRDAKGRGQVGSLIDHPHDAADNA